MLKGVPEAISDVQEQQREARGGIDEEEAAKFKENIIGMSEAALRFIDEQRQAVEALSAVEVSRAFEEPAKIYADSLTKATDAVVAFTTALTSADLKRGLTELTTRVTPGGRTYPERTSPQQTQQQATMNQQNMQSAVFGSNLENVTEAIRQAATEIARTTHGEGILISIGEWEAGEAVVKTLENFQGSLPDLINIIKQGGLDTEKITIATGIILKEYASSTSAGQLEFIGAIHMDLENLAQNIGALIDKPGLAKEPQPLVDLLPQEVLDLLKNITPTISPETEVLPQRTFEILSTSATTISEAASATKVAAEIATQSTENIKGAAINIKTGAFDILAASQTLSALTGELGTLQRPDGDVSTELSITITDPRVNEGQPTNIPTLVDGQIDIDALLSGLQVTTEQQEIAIIRAIERVKGGETLPSFNSIMEAVRAAELRSSKIISSSATSLSEAASETRMAADIVAQSTRSIELAAIDTKTGASDIVTAGQTFFDAAKNLQVVVDIQRETAIKPPKDMQDGGDNTNTQRAIEETTQAIKELGEGIDTINTTIELGIKQDADLAQEKEVDLQVDGLDENTEAVSENTTITEDMRGEMSNLNNGMSNVTTAMADGIGIDIETMSNIKVDVKGVSEAAEEFTSDFEAIATNVVKKEIHILLQQLARAAGDSETANLFESLG